MATEYRSEVIEGALGTEAIEVQAIASEAITMWSPVILAAAGSGEDLPRVATTATVADPLVYGVVVDRKRSRPIHN